MAAGGELFLKEKADMYRFGGSIVVHGGGSYMYFSADAIFTPQKRAKHMKSGIHCTQIVILCISCGSPVSGREVKGRQAQQIELTAGALRSCLLLVL